MKATRQPDPWASSIRKWEFWTNGRRRARTICVTLHTDELVITHRAVGTDGCMSELHAFTCDLERLPKLTQCLSRALAVATSGGLMRVKPFPRSATGALRTRARSRAPQ